MGDGKPEQKRFFKGDPKHPSKYLDPRFAFETKSVARRNGFFRYDAFGTDSGKYYLWHKQTSKGHYKQYLYWNVQKSAKRKWTRTDSTTWSMLPNEKYAQDDLNDY